MRECIRCGYPLDDNDQFCKRCGAIAQIEPKQPEAEKEAQKDNINNDFNDFGKITVEKNIEQTIQDNKYSAQANINNSSKKENPKKEENNKIYIVIIGMLVAIFIGIAIFTMMTVMKGSEKKDNEEELEQTSNEIATDEENEVENEINEEKQVAETLTFERI